MASINEEYITEYIRGLLPERTPFLKELETYAKAKIGRASCRERV